RKYLDFAAVADVQSILRQIHAVRRSTDLDNPSFDVKLGRGGIREIEFFVQTQQLILGGREPDLRTPRTLDGLAALATAGRIDGATAAALADGYTSLRMLEHRIQMLDDEQTHLLPSDEGRRARVAALCGHSDLDAFDRVVKLLRETVREQVRDLFPESRPLSASGGSLVFTGVDDDPETLATLAGYGFSDPSAVAARFRDWHRGVVRATRAERSREILTRLTPGLFEAWAATGEPDLAFSRFDTFLSGIPAGVQVLSLLEAQPAILRDTCATLGLSSRLALQLTRRPALLDSMLGQAFDSGLSLGQTSAMRHRFDQAFGLVDGFEGALDAARRVHREEMFRIGHHVLHGRVDAAEGGRAFTGLADAALQSLLPLALADVERVHGKLDARIAVLGWGKLGGRELSADSDLDIMIAYDVGKDVFESDGPRPLAPQVWVTRLTQRLITALSAQTAEGSLYEVDMQLRPSGNAGPVAVRLSALQRYYAGEAWTWELQALTRLRPVAGDTGLGDAIMALAADTLSRPRAARQIVADVVAMRARMSAHQKPRGPFDIKRLPGGLIDLEFITQAHLMLANAAGAGLHQPNTGAALNALAQAGALPAESAARLGHVTQTYNSLRQTMAVLGDAGLDLDAAPAGMRGVVARALGEPDFARVSAHLETCKAHVAAAWDELERRALHASATETG
ncbi:MAG: glutamine-synthetase adenylyltransferase, partial [Hyphomonadaceae bacterium]|nr:glutamine-synthetase adenylyltransferase [Hyphomonadaceae bacterium]